jgi:[NiFe] hydrogenase diaphorase moiety large subunit
MSFSEERDCMTKQRTEVGPRVRAIVDRYRADPTYMLQILREVQEGEGWISPAIVDQLETALNTPRTKIEAVAGFYSFLYTQPVGQYRVLFSDNITDHMLGNVDLLERMARKLGVERGKTSADGLVSIDFTSCTGMCDQGPALLVNNRAVTRLTGARIDQICELIQKRTPLSAWPAVFFQVDDQIRRSDILLNDVFAPGESIAAALARGPDALLEEIKLSNLRGRGGAGFQTGLKWELCRNAPGSDHYVVCNADEGEPGTFKDRVLLTSYADQVFEGMTLCAYVIGARRGLLYLRGEYRYLLEPLNAVLAQRRKLGLLGTAIHGQPGFDFDIEIHLGAGAYICGEESALIESLEGKRGTPRNRPPFPVTSGYLNQPTVVNNVETLMKSCMIARKGGAWYASVGTKESTGTKLLSIAGDCARPGIYEYPFGVTVAEILADCGAVNAQAVQISGAAGVCIAPDEFDRKIAFEDIPTAGSFMVFDQSRDMFEVARNFTHFFAHESCGFCTPCRVGTSLLVKMMDKLADGKGSPYDFCEIERLNEHMFKLSHCGLGYSACNPVLQTIVKFRPAYERRLVNKEFVPAFDLDGSLAIARGLTQRDDAAAHFGKD